MNSKNLPVPRSTNEGLPSDVTFTTGKGYLVIGNVHLGADPRILQTMASYARYYNMEVIHLGKLITDEEKRMEESRRLRIRTWENGLEERQTALDTADTPSSVDKIQRQIEKMSLDIESDVVESALLEGFQNCRLESLVHHFGKIAIVVNDEQHFPGLDSYVSQSNGNITKHDSEFHLGLHLMLAAIHPAGDKAGHQPISNIAFRYFRSMKDSFIVPHGAPSLQSFKAEGINKARNFFSTGSLHFEAVPKRASELGFTTNRMPAAVAVFIDTVTGEFHPRHVHIDFADGQFETGIFILDDGLAFMEQGAVIELKSADKGMFATDTHAPYENRGVVGCVRVGNLLHEPEEFIDGGDTADFESVNRHAKGPGALEGKRLMNCLSTMARVLDAYTNNQPSIKKKTLLDSNHAVWVDNFIEMNMCLKGLLDWKALSQSIFKGWKVILRDGGDDALAHRFGDLALRHGDAENLRDAVNGSFPKYLCGHWHSTTTFRRGAACGAATNLAPKYVGTNLTSWTNAFAFLSKYKGIASFHIANVLYDKPEGGWKELDPFTHKARFCYRNKIYSVPFHVYASERAAGKVSTTGPGLSLVMREA